MTGHKQTSKTIAVLMGPTGSGKSAMALAIAKSRPTVIINADAMQMVDALRVLSARPTLEEEAQAEHALYGVLRADEPTSVARWLSLVEPVIARAFAENKLPLLVGGTGMYVKSLRDGLASVPVIAEEVRQKYRVMAQPELHPALTKIDPVMAVKLKVGDTQRLIRALEVMEGTGTSLDHWQRQATTGLFPDAEYRSFYMQMPREELYARIDVRFEKMMAAGVLDEVRALLDSARRAAPSSMGASPDGAYAHSAAHTTMGLELKEWLLTLPPIFRAHGVPELIAHLNGGMTREAAIKKAQQNTRNYAKRQMTWIRNQMPEAVGVAGAMIPKI